MIKSYTDIEQSRKLTEILPIESADMYYRVTINGIATFSDIPTMGKRITRWDIPCWSLAALLKEIPEVINFDDDESDYTLEILKENELYYLSYGNPLRYGKIEIEPQENFVDACYEMVLKLHELKML